MHRRGRRVDGINPLAKLTISSAVYNNRLTLTRTLLGTAITTSDSKSKCKFTELRISTYPRHWIVQSLPRSEDFAVACRR